VKINKNAGIAVLAAGILGVTLTSSALAENGSSALVAPQSFAVTSTNASSPATSSVAPTTGIFIDSSEKVKSGIVSNAAVPAGYCQLNLGNVHMSTFSPGSVAANGKVECASGESIRVSSFVITLHKSGLIDHYFTGPVYGGVATYSQPILYNELKVMCDKYTTSTYWSTAHAVGVYADGRTATTDATSPNFPLPCGTTF